MTHDETVAAIREYCEKHGVKPEQVTRDRLRSEYPSVGRGGTWSSAKAEASGGAVSDVPVEVLPVGHKLKGVSSYLNAKGELVGQWVKTAAIHESPEEVLARLMRELPGTVPVREGCIERAPGPTREDLLAVYPLGDPHVGMLSWGRETGASFDLEICERLMVDAMRDLVLRGPRAQRALIVNLGDFFHFDNASHHTTRSDHALDVDGRTAKVLLAGIRIFVALIDAALEHHETVQVDCRVGNHDTYTSITLSLMLAAHYHNEPRVSIPPSIAHRAYHRFGRNLIGTTHGDRAKAQDLGAIMAAEAPEAWGATTHRVWLTGHVHHQSVKEYRGVKVESFRTLAARDSWHAAQGYVAGRDMQRITYHTEYGEIGREIAGIDYLLRGAA